MLVKNIFTSVVCAAVVACSTAAHASLEVTLTAGAFSHTIIDGNLVSGDSDGLANGFILNSALPVGDYMFFVTLSQTNEPGTAILASLDALTRVIDNPLVAGVAPPALVSIYAIADAFLAPTTPPAIVATSSAGATFIAGPGDSADVSYLAQVDGATVGSDGSTITFPGSAAYNDSTLITSLDDPYAIELLISADLNESGSSIDLQGIVTLSPIPEPGTVVVWSLLSVLALAAWRKMTR